MDTVKKTATLADLASQEKFESETGVWVPCYLFDGYLGQIKILNAANSDAYAKKRKSLEKTYRAKHGIRPEKELDIDTSLNITKEALITTAILDFEEFHDADGSALPSRDEFGKLHIENLRRLLEFKQIYYQLIKAIFEQETFNREKLDELEKN
jgi:hypothetical protein